MIKMKSLHIFLVSQLIVISPVHSEVYPSSFPVEAVGDFKVIDIHNPPSDGLWMNWDESRKFARALSDERNEWKMLYYKQQRDSFFNRDNDIVPIIKEDNRFWSHWGVPIGIGIGILLSVGIGVATIEATKR